jgi:hypothetical protein
MRSGTSATASTSGAPKRENMVAFMGVTLFSCTRLTWCSSDGGEMEVIERLCSVQ